MNSNAEDPREIWRKIVPEMINEIYRGEIACEEDYKAYKEWVHKIESTYTVALPITEDDYYICPG